MKTPTIHDTLRQILLDLGFQPKLVGYHFLYAAIPYFAQERTVSMKKELYPYIAKEFGYPDSRGIERPIRSAISDAWKRGRREMWERYFPNFTHAPSNMVFIATLAEHLK